MRRTAGWLETSPLLGALAVASALGLRAGAAPRPRRVPARATA